MTCVNNTAAAFAGEDTFDKMNPNIHSDRDVRNARLMVRQQS